MNELSSKSCVVLDHGMFVEVALRLARDFGKVYYVDPSHEESMPKIDHSVLGDGFREIERISEIWEVIDKVDLCVFPDVFHGYMQEHIANMGIPVWGGRRACELEVKKAAFRARQRQLGMNVPQYEVVWGLDDLRKFCEDPQHDDCWIKISPQYRGNRETFHHENYLATREILDQMGVDFGIVQDAVKFLCEKTIPAEFESGVDTYTVDGEHPAAVLQAYERKDKCCIGAVQQYAELPTALRQTIDYLWPLFREYGARQFCSTEVRIADDGKAYLLEPTVRCASPAGEPQQEIIANYSEVIWSGANGSLVEPQWAGKFYCQVMMDHHGDAHSWRSIQIPKEIRRWVKLYNCCGIKDRIGLAPMDEIVGSVLGIGNTIEEAIAHVREVADALSDQPVAIRVEDMADTLAQIAEAQEAGLKFTGQRVPDPEAALEG